MAEKAKQLLAKIRFIEWLSLQDLSALQLRIAVMLVSLYSFARGFAWPHLDDIAANAHTSKRSAQRVIEALERKGLFDITRSVGRGHANEYRPRFDRVPEGDVYNFKKVTARTPFSAAPDAPEKVTIGAEKVTIGALKGDRQDTPSELSSELYPSVPYPGHQGVGAVDSETVNGVHRFIRETEQRIGEGCLQNMTVLQLEDLASAIETASGYFVEPTNGVIAETPDEHCWMQCERLRGNVMAEIEDRDVPQF